MTSAASPFLSVVIACFNEEQSAARFGGELFPALEALGVSYEVLAIDDGSTDATLAVLRAQAEGRPALRVLALDRNQGLGAALRAGFDAARGVWIVTLDADLTFHPRQIKTLLDRQEETGADLVAGSPFSGAKAFSPAISWTRLLPSLLLNAFYRGLCDPRFTAYTPIFRLYRGEALKPLPLAATGFEINAEIAARFYLAKKKLAEAPALLTTRTEGRSKLKRPRELRRHLSLIAKLMANLLK